jgi:AraC family transcriptional regulator
VILIHYFWLLQFGPIEGFVADARTATLNSKGGSPMLSANFAVDPIRTFPGIAPPKMQSQLFKPAARPGHALSVLEAGTYGTRMAKHWYLASAPTIRVKTPHQANLAVTRLRSEMGMPERTTPFPYEPAFAVQVQLKRVVPVKSWLGGQLTALDSTQDEGSVSIIDLKQGPSMYLGSAFDMVQFYIPRVALDEFAEENHGSRCETLTWPAGKVDAGLKNLASCLLPALEEAAFSSELYVDHLVFAARAYIARTYGGVKIAPSLVRGGLAPWQLNRALDMLRANLDGQIGLSEVARECKLSVSHFVRAFKQAVGQPPYRWLLQQRIDTAKELLLHSGLPMVEVALKCGFADQACFIRAFRKLLDTTPGEWRRMRLQ